MGRVARGLRTAFSDRYDPEAPAAYPAVHHPTSPMRRWAAENADRDRLHLSPGTGFREPLPAAEVIAGLGP